jgi:hypothetical protein
MDWVYKKKLWFPLSCKGKKWQRFVDWLNKWGDFDKHKECFDSIIKTPGGKPNHITEYGQGYNKAISDVFDKLSEKKAKVGGRHSSHTCKCVLCPLML